MKKILQTSIILLCAIRAVNISAQNNAIAVHYTMTMNITDDVKEIEDPSLRQLVIDSYKSVSERYTAYYNNVKYVFTKADIDDKSKTLELDGGLSIYTDSKTNKAIAYKSIIDRSYIVEYQVSSHFQWNIANDDTKLILGKQCMKATTTGEDGGVIVAYFTPEIPTPTGPYGYNGLPGLILRLNTKQMTFEATDVTAVSAEVDIKEPKGKTITQDEYNKIKDKKLKSLGVSPNGSRGGVQVIKM
ncbi:MAG: GLPGLI family protein [Bacteroidales bacterium]|nr:GLPGLI family protein [Bacteroidales bacterium]